MAKDIRLKCDCCDFDAGYWCPDSYYTDCISQILPDELPFSFMKTIRDLMLAGFCCLFLVGCSDDWLVTVPADKPATKETIAAYYYFDKLAGYVEKGIIQHRHELAQYVKAMQDAGDLSASDVSAFDNAIPNATTDWTNYTDSTRSADAAALRGVK